MTATGSLLLRQFSILEAQVEGSLRRYCRVDAWPCWWVVDIGYCSLPFIQWILSILSEEAVVFCRLLHIRTQPRLFTDLQSGIL